MLRFPAHASCVAAVLLVAATGAGAETARFASTGAEQTFTVPVGVTSLRVTAVGGRGGGTGGFGALVFATLPVVPGQVLHVEVGGNGIAGAVEDSGVIRIGRGGFNGGADGGTGSGLIRTGDGGGGATDVRASSRTQPSSLGTRLVVAAGGGGGGNDGTPGGSAGASGATGVVGRGTCSGGGGGGPGTATAGGSGGTLGTIGPGRTPSGTAGRDGQLGQGGTGEGGQFGGGGGGGGGLHGGGGGASGVSDFPVFSAYCLGGGGGGGSSGFASSATSTLVAIDTTGVPSVTFEWTAAGAGEPSGPSGPGADTVAPRLSALALSPTAFVAANVGPSAVAAARIGTRVSYRLSEAARVTFAVERAAPGIRSRGRCVRRPRRAAANAGRCTRWIPRPGSFAQDASAGANSIRFMGRLRGRSLAAGGYRLVATARDAAGNAPRRPARRGFTILRP